MDQIRRLRSSSESSKALKGTEAPGSSNKIFRLLGRHFSSLSQKGDTPGKVPVSSPSLPRTKGRSGGGSKQGLHEDGVQTGSQEMEKDRLETIHGSRPFYPYPNPYATTGLPPAPAHGILRLAGQVTSPSPLERHFHVAPSPVLGGQPGRDAYALGGGGSLIGTTEDEDSSSSRDTTDFEMRELDLAAAAATAAIRPIELVVGADVDERADVMDSPFPVEDLVGKNEEQFQGHREAVGITDAHHHLPTTPADDGSSSLGERRPTGFFPPDQVIAAARRRLFLKRDYHALHPSSPTSYALVEEPDEGAGDSFKSVPGPIMSTTVSPPPQTKGVAGKWFDRKNRPADITVPDDSLEGEPLIPFLRGLRDPVGGWNGGAIQPIGDGFKDYSQGGKKTVQLCSQASIIPESPRSSNAIITGGGGNGAGYDHFAYMSPITPPFHKRSGGNEKERSRAACRKVFYSKLSYLYALVLISIGFSLPVSDAIAQNYPLTYYEVYYVYLYGMSLCFFAYTYFFLIRFYTKTDTKRKASVVLMHRGRSIDTDAAKLLIKKQRVTEFESSTGSFYLRMGAIAFGIGNMIYNGLQFGEFFDSNFSPHCSEILNGLIPALNLAFTFIQTYFIFSHSKICIHKYKTLARFGLMHVVATNICVWIITLVRQTIEEIEWYHHEIAQHLPPGTNVSVVSPKKIDMSSVRLQCQKNKKDIIMSKLVENASPFLYPCTIEYSLICAAISYVMWKNIGEVPRFRKSRRARNSYTVNCENASKGLFFGIFLIVFCIISLILFFVLIEKKEYFLFAVFLNQITEITVYLLALGSIILAFYQMRPLKFLELRDREKLDSQLLSIAVAGEYLFSTFSIVSAVSFVSYKSVLLLTGSVINIVQSTVQTVFIVDALNRFCVTEKTEDAKPGRQLVTFLILCNFALWAFNTFANERTRTNPIQIEFYGYVTWNIITHICTPLSIFYRYHSTACLSEIWKQGYKTHIDESLQ